MKKYGKRIISEVVLYSLVVIMGIMLISFPTFGLIEPVYYVSILFYLFAFLSIIVYFIERRDGDYELLFLSLINILSASFMFLLKENNMSLVLGTGMTIFIVLFLINKGYSICKLKKNDNYIWVIEFMTSFLVVFLTLLTIINLYKGTTVTTLMFGFYFIAFGIFELVVPLFKIFAKSETFDNFIKSIVSQEQIEIPKKEKKKTRKKKTVRKITKK